MRHLPTFALVLVIATALPVSACSSSRRTTTRCFQQVPVSNVLPTGNDVGFTITAGGKASTFSVRKDAFGGAPTAMIDGDSVSFCVNQVEADGQVTTTLSQFVIGARPQSTSTP